MIIKVMNVSNLFYFRCSLRLVTTQANHHTAVLKWVSLDALSPIFRGDKAVWCHLMETWCHLKAAWCHLRETWRHLKEAYCLFVPWNFISRDCVLFLIFRYILWEFDACCIMMHWACTLYIMDNHTIFLALPIFRGLTYVTFLWLGPRSCVLVRPCIYCARTTSSDMLLHLMPFIVVTS